MVKSNTQFPNDTISFKLKNAGSRKLQDNSHFMQQK